MLINCSEPVRAESHEKFHRKFGNYGIRREVLAACYAMAETTFAATQTAPSVESRKVSVDREALAQGRVRIVEGDNGVRVCVSSGAPISGCEMRIISDSGESNIHWYRGRTFGDRTGLCDRGKQGGKRGRKKKVTTCDPGSRYGDRCVNRPGLSGASPLADQKLLGQAEPERKQGACVA